MSEKPNVLVLGGLGFIGRHFVHYLIKNNLVTFVRVVDKGILPTAYLSEEHAAVFSDATRVDVVQANLASQAGIDKAFNGSIKFDYVINLAAETKYGQAQEVYDEKVLNLSIKLGTESAKQGCKVFVEMSTAQIYEADKKPSLEESKIKPWTMLAKSKAKAEDELQKIPGLNLVILRPAIVYGTFDVNGITPRLIIGAVYRQLKEEMKLLWTKDLKMHTVHVLDVVRAIWYVCAMKEQGGGRSEPVSKCEIYNLADKNDTDQGKVNKFIESIFGIKTGFQGTIVSQFAKLNLDTVTEDVNDMHLEPWSNLCKKGNVFNTPLTPYLDKELLKDNALSVDGSKIEKELGFKYDYPNMNEQSLRLVIDEFVKCGIWPKGTTD